MMIIGLTPACQASSGDTLIPRLYANRDYWDAVLRAGALPVLLPLTADTAVLDAMVDAVDGFVFCGGADVSPSVYGEDKLPCCGENAPERDFLEIYLLKKAMEHQKPFLAICRGMQLFSCARGGTMYQDIGLQFSDQLFHPDYDRPWDLVHTARVTPGTRLFDVVGREEIGVNSRHHQGIKVLGADLVPNAYAPDGFLEGIELPGEVFQLGVQWHPETLAAAQPEEQALFDALVADCSRRKG